MASLTKSKHQVDRPKMIWLMSIILLAVFFRFFMLASYPPSLYSDEAVNGVNALQALESHHFKIFYPENNGREGLFINIQAFFVWLFGPEAWALHIASALFSILTVLGLYLLTKELVANKESAKIALLTAFFLAISFWHINFSRIGFRAITAPFWSVWAFYLFFIARKKLLGPERANKNFWPWSLLTGAVLGLGFNSYISYRVLPAVLGLLLIYMFLEVRRAKILKDFYIALGLMALGGVITISPLLVHFAKIPQDFLGRTDQLSVFKSTTPLKDLTGNILKTAGMFNIAGDFNQRQNIAGTPQLFWPVGFMFLLGFYLACKTTFREVLLYLKKKRSRKSSGADPINPTNYFFLLFWFAVGALPVVISNEGIPHALRSIIMIPPTFIFAGIGGVYLYSWLLRQIRERKHKQAWLRTLYLSISLIAILLVLQAFYVYFITWGESSSTKSAFSYDYNQKAYEIRSLPQNITKFVVYDPGDIGINITQFLTDTATPRSQIEHNLYYVPRNQLDMAHLPKDTLVTELK